MVPKADQNDLEEIFATFVRWRDEQPIKLSTVCSRIVGNTYAVDAFCRRHAHLVNDLAALRSVMGPPFRPRQRNAVEHRQEKNSTAIVWIMFHILSKRMSLPDRVTAANFRVAQNAGQKRQMQVVGGRSKGVGGIRFARRREAL